MPTRIIIFPYLFFSFLFFFFFLFLGYHQQHVEVPRLGIQSELQLPAHTVATTTQVPSCVCTYTTAHINTGSLTHWLRPGIEPTSARILVGLISAEPQWELLSSLFWRTYCFVVFLYQSAIVYLKKFLKI